MRCRCPGCSSKVLLPPVVLRVTGGHQQIQQMPTSPPPLIRDPILFICVVFCLHHGGVCKSTPKHQGMARQLCLLHIALPLWMQCRYNTVVGNHVGMFRMIIGPHVVKLPHYCHVKNFTRPSFQQRGRPGMGTRLAKKHTIQVKNNID